MLSAPALIESENDLKTVRRLQAALSDIPGALLEVNDLGAVNIVADSLSSPDRI